MESNVSCWICFGEGLQDEWEPLLGDKCSCRGSLGHFHLSCVIRLKRVETLKAADRSDDIPLSSTWLHCHNCKQYFSPTLTPTLGHLCYIFVRDWFPSDRVLQVHAQAVKLRGMTFNDDNKIEDIERMATELLSAIDDFQNESTPISKSTKWAQGVAYCTLGNVSLARQDCSSALDYFTKFKNDLISRNFDSTDYEVTNVERQIEEITAFGTDETASNETIARLQKTCFEKAKNKFGESSGVVIDQEVLILTQALLHKGHNKRSQAATRLRELYPVSCRVYGPKHYTSKAIEEMLADLRKLGYLEVLTDPNRTDHMIKHLIELYNVSHQVYRADSDEKGCHSDILGNDATSYGSIPGHAIQFFMAFCVLLVMFVQYLWNGTVQHDDL